MEHLTEYKNEKLHGKEVRYFPNGDIEYQSEYRDGKKEGKEI